MLSLAVYAVHSLGSPSVLHIISIALHARCFHILYHISFALSLNIINQLVFAFVFCWFLFVCLCCYHLHTLHIITGLICCVKELLLCSLLFVCLLLAYFCLIVTHFCFFLLLLLLVSLYSLLGTPL